MKTRTEIINYLIEKHNLKSYLEIGVQRKVNFNQIKAAVKKCVDPDPQAKADYLLTSDSYFQLHKNKYDLIFIDGLHHYEQVKKDFENALNILNTGGFIMLHDTWPNEEIHTAVPRKTSVWNGDVYRLACELSTYDGINYLTIPFDHGCTVIWKNETAKGEPIPDKITWEWYLSNRESALRATYTISI